MSSPEDLQIHIATLRGETFRLWEENRDLQASFMRIVPEIRHLNKVVNEANNQEINIQLGSLREQGNIVHQQLIQKRWEISQKLGEALDILANMQGSTIFQLRNWKYFQKLEQIGYQFENKETLLTEIQQRFEFIAEQGWEFYTLTSCMTDLLRRDGILNDPNSKQTMEYMINLENKLRTLLVQLISQSFVVTILPEPSLRTQSKFLAEVCLLIGDKLGIRQQLLGTSVIIKMISESDAKEIDTRELHPSAANAVGKIAGFSENIIMNGKNQLAAKFSQSKLLHVDQRKTAAKSISEMNTSATEQKYAFLFSIPSFSDRNFGQLDLWTMSIPFVVTVANGQECAAQGAILWHRAFAPDRTENFSYENVTWDSLKNVLVNKFRLFTKAKRALCEQDLEYMRDKLVSHGFINEQGYISYHQFAKTILSEKMPFSFWEWFFSIMLLVKHKLLTYWDKGWLYGFISKQQASNLMMKQPHCSFMVRFSDNRPGSISIGFVTEEGGIKSGYHLMPATGRDLELIPLYEQIEKHQELNDIYYAYPKIPKEEILEHFRETPRTSSNLEGYIESQLVLVAKTIPRHSGSTCSSSHSTDDNMNRERSYSGHPTEMEQFFNTLDDMDIEPINIDQLLGLPSCK